MILLWYMMKEEKKCSRCKTITKNVIRFAKRGEIQYYMCNPCNTKRVSAFYKKNPVPQRNAVKRSIAKHRHKQRARELLNYHLKKGHITKPTACEKCNLSDVRIQAHHEDYTKPLEVHWLCITCHSLEHSDVVQ